MEIAIEKEITIAIIISILIAISIEAWLQNTTVVNDKTNAQ